MNWKKLTDSNIFYIVAGIILALLSNQALALALGTDTPLVAVESNSMVPTFQRGDILILVGVDPADIVVGDIIVFLPDGHSVPIVHRVISLNADGSVQTKGDANANQFEFEKRVLPQQIKGKQVVIVPYLGWVKIVANDLVNAVRGAVGL